MKILLTAGCAFAPESRRLDFSGRSRFDVRRLLAVIHSPSGRRLYVAGKPGLGYASLADRVLTLQADTSGLGASDPLSIFYEETATASAFTSPAAAAPIATGSGSLFGYDLFNVASLAQVVSFYDTAQPPPANTPPLARIILGSGQGRALTIPHGLPFTAGLWAGVTARGSSPPASIGDVAGTLLV